MKRIAKIIFDYFQRRIFPYWGIIIVDCITYILSAFFVLTANYTIWHFMNNFYAYCIAVLMYSLFYLLGFRLFRTYAGVMRFSSFVDLQRVAGAVMLGMVASVAVHLALEVGGGRTIVRIRDIMLWSALSLVVMWAIRVTVKFFYDSTYQAANARRAFVYGIREGGVSIAKSLRSQTPARYILDGFVSDEPAMCHKVLMGVNVFPNDDSLVDTMQRMNVTCLFVSPLKSNEIRKNTRLVNALIDAHIKIFMVPVEREWDGRSDITHAQLHEIDIEDLLPRQKIEIDLESIGKLLAGEVIMVTGAAGSIGSEIVRQVATFGPGELILIDQAETPLHDIRLMMRRDFPGTTVHTIVADITTRSRMEDIFSAHRPMYVFHAAAYKHVPMMEDNPGESIHNNVLGTRILADLAVKYGTRKFVMVSTDKAVNPTNVMGCSKRICEIYVQSLDRAQKDGLVQGNTHFVTTRFGNVLGSNGSVIPLFKEQIRRGGPITVTHPNIIRYFMLIPEACKLVLEAGTMGNGGEIFVFDMGEPVKIVDLAVQMIKLSGAKIKIRFTGLREGEKLYEDILTEDETTLPTFHPKIKIARVRQYDYGVVCDKIDRLVRVARGYDNMQIVRLMKDLVPEYKSQNSVYQTLDQESETERSRVLAEEMC